MISEGKSFVPVPLIILREAYTRPTHFLNRDHLVSNTLMYENAKTTLFSPFTLPSAPMGTCRVVVGRTNEMKRVESWSSYLHKQPSTVGGQQVREICSLQSVLHDFPGGKLPCVFWVLTILIYPWQMKLVVLSKLRTALHLKGLCFLELNIRKCHGNPNESKVETAPWLILSCQSCGDERPAPGFQQCPLFL